MPIHRLCDTGIAPSLHLHFFWHQLVYILFSLPKVENSSILKVNFQNLGSSKGSTVLHLKRFILLQSQGYEDILSNTWPNHARTRSNHNLSPTNQTLPRRELTKTWPDLTTTWPACFLCIQYFRIFEKWNKTKRFRFPQWWMWQSCSSKRDGKLNFPLASSSSAAMPSLGSYPPV